MHYAGVARWVRKKSPGDHYRALTAVDGSVDAHNKGL